MRESDIRERIERLTDSFLGTTGEQRNQMVLEYIRLKEELHAVRDGRGPSPVTVSKHAAG